MKPLLSLLPGLLLVLGACGRSLELPWVTATCANANVTIRGAAEPDRYSTLILGKPRSPDEFPGAGAQALAFGSIPGDFMGMRILASAEPTSAPAVEVTLPLTALDEGYYVLQWVTREQPAFALPVAGVSEPLYLLRREGSCEVLGLGSYVWLAHRETWLALAAALATLLVLAFQRRIPQRPLALLVAVVATGAALLFVGMRAASRADQGALDSGFHLPNFYVTSSWEFGGDSEERVLGPGFRELAQLIRDHRRPGEGLFFHIVDDQLADVPMARGRAAYLRRQFPDGRMVFEHHTAGPGLSVYFGSTPDGAVLARGRLAVLARLEAGTR